MDSLLAVYSVGQATGRGVNGYSPKFGGRFFLVRFVAHAVPAADLPPRYNMCRLRTDPRRTDGLD